MRLLRHDAESEILGPSLFLSPLGSPKIDDMRSRGGGEGSGAEPEGKTERRLERLCPPAGNHFPHRANDQWLNVDDHPSTGGQFPVPLGNPTGDKVLALSFCKFL